MSVLLTAGFLSGRLRPDVASLLGVGQKVTEVRKSSFSVAWGLAIVTLQRTVVTTLQFSDWVMEACQGLAIPSDLVSLNIYQAVEPQRTGYQRGSR